MKVLVTGAAGFIGFHTAKQLLERGETIVGLDNFNDYYDVRLKEARAALLEPYDNFRMARISLEDRAAMEALFAREKFDKVVHLAAQAGVRYSIENPHSYIDSNIVGTLHILEGCRHHDVEHAVLDPPERRSSAGALRGDQESQRTYGAHLLEPVRPADDGPSVLHRLRSVGAPRHGAVPVHEEHHCR
jgi:nucleoside-diphosphate-sugar epimerase